jgi:pimeloyl-ACP methyl ester carboxylesterase
LGHDIRPHLSEIVAPTLVIHAGEDMITGPRTTMPLEEGLPNSVGVSMDRVAHVVAGKEEKIIFGEILFDFLNAH